MAMATQGKRGGPHAKGGKPRSQEAEKPSKMVVVLFGVPLSQPEKGILIHPPVASKLRTAESWLT